LAAGLQIISTGTAALNGTSAIDAGAQTEITGIISLIGAGIGMPQDPLPWADINGARHNFAGADFKNVAKAVSLYMLGLRSTWNALRAGQQANWPDQPVAIP
jgi:hypothetical protein